MNQAYNNAHRRQIYLTILKRQKGFQGNKKKLYPLNISSLIHIIGFQLVSKEKPNYLIKEEKKGQMGVVWNHNALEILCK